MLAPAKINLYLHVVGRRADGYHLLDSLIVFAEAGDVVTARLADRISLQIDGPFSAKLQADDDNLILRAARGLAALTGTQAGAEIRLTKNLPIASGIGGGSADAAATLRVLTSHWRVAPERPALEQLALKLGADVPVCLDSRPSFIGGIGEEIVPAGALPAIHMLLVNPGVATATPAVFKARTSAFSQPARWTAPPGDIHALVAFLRERRNDLTDAAIIVTPVIREALNAIERTEHCLLARLSGSGATCFGLYATAEASQAARDKIQAVHPAWWTVATRIAA